MTFLRGHLLAVSIVLAAVAATGGVFAFARPEYHPYVLPSPPNDPLPYTTVSYSAADAQRAFGMARIKLVRHSHQPVPVGSPPIVDLSDRGTIVDVDVFGDPQRVAASGFHDYFTFANGHWVKAPKTCSPGARSAERWHGNVRVIVACWRAGPSAASWLARVDRAFAQLP